MSSPTKFKNIIRELGSIARSYGISNSFVVGGYPRSVIMNSVKEDAHDLDIASAWPGEATKLGSIAASELINDFPEVYHRTGTVKFTYKDVDLEFQGSLGSMSDTQPVTTEMERYGIIVSPLTTNLYSRDFTINTLVQDLETQNIYDIVGFAIKDLENGIIRTPINPQVSLSINPLIILRAIRFSLRYDFEIERRLSSSIRKFKHLLFSEYSSERLQIEILKMLQEDYDGTLKKLEDYELEETLKNRNYDIYKILDTIDITKYTGDLSELVQEKQ